MHDHGEEIIVADHGLQLLLLLSGHACGLLVVLHLLVCIVGKLSLVVLNDRSAYLLTSILVFIFAPNLVQWTMLACTADIGQDFALLLALALLTSPKSNSLLWDHGLVEAD